MAVTRCKAKAKSSGEQCRQPVVPGRELCRYHGGKSPRGRESPAWRHGLYSKHAPTQLAALMRQAIESGDGVSVRSEAAIIEARIAQLLGQIETGELGERWKAAKKALRRFDSAGEDVEEARAALNGLRALIYAGADEADVWAELADQIELRRRLSETERRTIEAQQRYVTMESLAAIMDWIAAIIVEEVVDAGTRQRILLRLERQLELADPTQRGPAPADAEVAMESAEATG